MKKKLDDYVPRFFGYYEEQLKHNTSKEFLVGNNYTTADFHFLGWYSVIHGHPARKEIFSKVLKKYPLLEAYYNKREEAQREYFDNRPKCAF